MKRLHVGTIALAAVLSIGLAANVSAFEISYDGFCDGLMLNIDPATGLVDGNQAGCTVGPILGTRGRTLTQGPTVTIGYDASSDFGGLGIITVIRADGTWTHYMNDGSGISVVNSGTWSMGPAAVAEGTGGTSLGKDFERLVK